MVKLGVMLKNMILFLEGHAVFEKWTYKLNESMTIEQLLREKWVISRKTIHELRMAKSITNNSGEPLRWNEPIPPGTELSFHLPDASSSYIPEEDCKLTILFEDEHCLVVCKPKGMPTHPNAPTETGTAMNEVMAYIKKCGGDYAEHVHRLDSGTSGLLLIAKHPIAKGVFDRMLEEKRIIRTYEAEVKGQLKKAEGTVNAPIGRDRHHPTRRRVSPNGQKAITHFWRIKGLKDSTIVHVRLETGRTHQIRVHMSHIGHPIIGDTLYGGPAQSNGYRLHAFKLEFSHPFTEKQLVIEDTK